MHKRSLVLWENKFGNLIIQLGEMKVERLNSLTVLVCNVIVFPQLFIWDLRLPISGLKPVNYLFPSGKNLEREIDKIYHLFPFERVDK